MVRATALAESPTGPVEADGVLDFETVYQDHFDFVWRSLRRLGVPDSAIDDATQDVFVVAHRGLARFRGDSSVKTWLFAIAFRVARRHRPARGSELVDAESLPDTSARSPQEVTLEEEARRLLYRILEGFDEERRAVFILSELEGMSAPEIAEALGVKLNTVYSRLRLARADFSAEVRRYRARSVWRTTP
jgi:RNA polymerase sigma-70 factor (ECF subfamily)